MADRAKLNRHAEYAIPPEDYDPNDFSVLLRSEHIPRDFSFLMPKDHAFNDFSVLPPEYERGHQRENLSDKKHSINDAIDKLMAVMSRAEPNLLRADAREALSKTVHTLLRDAGKVA